MILTNYSQLIPTLRFTCFEAIKLGVVQALMHRLSIQMLAGSLLAPKNIAEIVVRGPLREEILFRGVLQSSIQGMQGGYQKFWVKREPTLEESERQKKIRIHLASAAFAAAHLGIPYGSTFLKVKNFAFCYYSGLAYGFLREKYQTIGLPYFFHGTSNLLACCRAASMNGTIKRLYEAAIYANLLGAFVLGLK